MWIALIGTIVGILLVGWFVWWLLTHDAQETTVTYCDYCGECFTDFHTCRKYQDDSTDHLSSLDEERRCKELEEYQKNDNSTTARKFKWSERRTGD